MAWVAWSVALWLLIAFAASAARVLTDFPVHELQRACRLRRRRKLFEEVMESHEAVAQSAYAVAMLSTVVATLFVCQSLAPNRLASRPVPLAAILVAAVVALMTAHLWIPSAVAEYRAASFILRTWRLWVVVHRILVPLRAVDAFVSLVAARLSGTTRQPQDEEEAFEEEIRAIVTEGMHDGLLEDDARKMIESVIQLDEVDVADIMTPRSKVEAIDVDTSWSELMDFVIRVRRTRIPVYEGKLDHIVGVLYVKDLLPELVRPEAERKSLKELVRQRWFVPPTKPVDELLREFRQTRSHLAIVLDEFQSVAGVVTIEDALEKIVGEIEDEYDSESRPAVRVMDDGRLEVEGRAHVAELNREFGLAFPESDEYDTIGGWLIHHLKRIPRPGERVPIDQSVVTVLEADDRTVSRLLIERRNRRPAATPETM